MDTQCFDYELPAALIAQVPAPHRDASKLMVIDRHTQAVTHCQFKDIVDFLPPDTALFRNNAAVLKARLRGTRASGGAVECLLLSPGKDGHEFWCLLKPGKRLPPGAAFTLNNGVTATVLDKNDAGQFLVRFNSPVAVTHLADAIGEIPLPPYIERQRDAQPELRAMDQERYQTVYADPTKKVAAAAPTAGLHFTPEIFQQLDQRAIPQYEITLHIGLGTFQPIQTETIEEHRIHRELYELPSATQIALKQTNPGTRLAVGTTSLRAIEDYLRKSPDHAAPDNPAPYVGEADIFIYPPAQFRGVDALLTNFHLPRSTLVCLVAAFLTPNDKSGIDWLKKLYSIAIDRQYRFYSYGDAMLIL